MRLSQVFQAAIGGALVFALAACGGNAEDTSTTELAAAKASDPLECSVQVPDPEPADLTSLAKISADQARDVALGLYPGEEVVEVELDNEDGCLVFGIEFAGGHEVKVDAGNGKVLYEESDAEDDGPGDDNEEGGHDD